MSEDRTARCKCKELEDRIARLEERKQGLLLFRGENLSFNTLADRVEIIEEALRKVSKPSKPTEEYKCKECGTKMVSGGEVGYYCPNDDCPCWDVFKPKKPLPSKVTMEDVLIEEHRREKAKCLEDEIAFYVGCKSVTWLDRSRSFKEITDDICKIVRRFYSDDTIRISRKVAEEWLREINHERYDHRELQKEIRKNLEEK